MKLTDMRDMMLGLQDASDRLGREDQIILQFMKSYFDQMFAVERDDVKFHESELADDPVSSMKYMEESVDRKLTIHQQFWCNDTDYYKPNGMSNMPHHDWSQVEGIKVLRTGDSVNPQFVFLYAYNDILDNRPSLQCFILKVLEDTPRIEHSFF